MAEKQRMIEVDEKKMQERAAQAEQKQVEIEQRKIQAEAEFKMQELQ